MLKILILNDEPWDSGITNYALQIARIFHQRGQQVVMGIRPGKKPEKFAQKAGIPTIAIPNPLALRRELIKNQYDIINPHTGRTHSWSVCAQWGLQKIPIIRTRGDARPLKTNFMVRWVYRHTEAIIAASEHVRKQYAQGFRFSDEKARVVYPSVKPDAQISFPPKNRVGILGRLDPVKGHAILLEAAARVIEQKPEIQFSIAGREANVCYSELENQAKQLGILKNIQFLGFQDSAVAFMRSCSLGVIPSIGSEEVSRACLEWMSVGRAVVGTLVGCLPELIEPRETGLLIPPGQSGDMADAILSILNQPDLMVKWGHNAYEIASRRFSEDAMFENTHQAFAWAQQHKSK